MTILCNVIFKRISISISINQSILLEQVNTFTLLNALHVICIPCSVSDGMSSSNSIIYHHYPISLCLSTRNCSHLLWVKKEKEDLINQSLWFILLIINSFDSTVSSSPWRDAHSRVMDWSRIRSHSSFSQSFILSNTIEWHFQNVHLSSRIDMREGRFFNSNDS